MLRILYLSILLTGCFQTISSNKTGLEDNQTLKTDSKTNSEPVLEDWLYGQGLGVTATNILGIILFPPYAVYVLGNSALTLGGYQPIYWSQALPSETREKYLQYYDKITEMPGRFSAAITQKEFRDKEFIMSRDQGILDSDSQM